MAVKTQELKDAVKVLMAATSNKDLVLQMSHLVFKEDEILAYNDRLCICHPLDSGVNCSVPAEDLNKALSGISDNEIEIEVGENEVVFSSESTTVTISTEIESRIVEEFFNTVDFDAMEWKAVPSNFLDKLSLARFSTSSNILDANNLHCVNVNGSFIYSGDGYRLSTVEMNGDMDNVLIPGNTVNDLIGFDKFDDYSIVGGWIHFASVSGVVVSCRIILGDFPDFSPFFDNFKGQKEITLEPSMIPVLQNIGGLVEGESNFMKSVNIKLKRGETLISGKKEGLTINKKLKNSHGGSDLEFNVSPVFLAHILGITSKLSIGEGQALFKGPEFKHIVQLPVQ